MTAPLVQQETWDLPDVVVVIRKHPKTVLELPVTVVIQRAMNRWRQSADFLAVSEEVPWAAWVVRKKAEGLVAPPVEENLDPTESADVRPVWIDQAVGHLKALGEQAGIRFERPPGDVRLPSVPPPVKDATIWKLAWSYPKVRPVVEPRPRLVYRDPETLAQRIQWLRQRLKERPRWLWQDTVDGQSRADQILGFLAALHLWHHQEIELQQEAPFEPLWIIVPEERHDPS